MMAVKMYQQKMLNFRKRRREDDCSQSTAKKIKHINVEVSSSSFNLNDREPLLCRDKEVEFISDYISSHLEDHTPGSLYISGPPGTGKSVTISHVLAQDGCGLEKADLVTVNCLSATKPLTVISDHLRAKGRTIHQKITSSKKMIVVVLDEVDSLSQDDLYEVFEWPGIKKSKIILIGIANTLDLIDRVLPRLLAVRYRPTLLCFSPYTRQEITAILTGTLKGGVSAIEPVALQYVARKVATRNGDIRRAMDICRRATENCSGLPATIKQIATMVSDSEDRVSHFSLPTHQKLVACSLLYLIKTLHLKEHTINDLYKKYVQVCEIRHIKYESDSEFMSMTEQLEVMGVINLGKKKKKLEDKSRRVRLDIDEDKLRYVLQDNMLISSILAE